MKRAMTALVVSNVMDFVYEEVLDFKGYALKLLYALVDWWSHLHEPKRTGPLADFIGNGKFEVLSLFIVCLNCSYIIFEQNATLATMNRDSVSFSGPLELAFTVFFLFELVMRIVVHRLYFFCNDEMGWNIIDFCIVTISTLQALQGLLGDAFQLQLSFLRTFRIMKLARVLRLMRMVKVFSDLRVMVIAFLNSCLALFWCMVLLAFTIAMFALVFVQMVGEYLIENHQTYSCDGEDACLFEELKLNFGSVQKAMLSLYMATTGGNDWGYYYDMIAATSDFTAFIFVFYTAFYYFGVFNLLTGMFVDKAVRASQPDQDMLIFEQRMQETDSVKAFLQIFNQFDVDHDGLISEPEFEQVISSDQGRIFLGILGLQPSDTRIVFEALSAVQPKVPVTEFVKGCMRMRGNATSIDMHSMQFEIQHIHLLLEDVHHDLLQHFHGAHSQRSAPDGLSAVV